MTYTVSTLITNAYYLSGVVSEKLQVVSGDQIIKGLNLLNDLLAIKTVDKRMIPYFQEYDLTTVTSTGTYFVPNLIQIETLTYYINSARFSVNNIPRRRFYGRPQVDGINSVLTDFHAERALGGTNITFYFVPDAAYPVVIWGKFSLGSVTQFQDLQTILDQWYITYLRYALAEYIAEDFGKPLKPSVSAKLATMEKTIMDISPLDMNMTKMSTLGSKQRPDVFGDANLGWGWTT